MALRSVVLADKLLDLNSAAKKLVESAVRAELYGLYKAGDLEIPLFLHHMPNGDVLREEMREERIRRSRIVLSLALRDSDGEWIKDSIHSL